MIQLCGMVCCPMDTDSLLFSISMESRFADQTPVHAVAMLERLETRVSSDTGTRRHPLWRQETCSRKFEGVVLLGSVPLPFCHVNSQANFCMFEIILGSEMCKLNLWNAREAQSSTNCRLHAVELSLYKVVSSCF